MDVPETMSAQDIDALGLVGQVATGQRAAQQLEAQRQMQDAGRLERQERQARDIESKRELLKERLAAKRVGKGSGGGARAGAPAMSDTELLDLAGGDALLAEAFKRNPKLREDAFKKRIQKQKELSTAIEKKGLTGTTADIGLSKAEIDAQKDFGKRMDAVQDANVKLQQLERHLPPEGSNIPGIGTAEGYLPTKAHELLAEWGGVERSKKALQVRRAAEPIIQAYRKATTGVAFSPQELKRILKGFGLYETADEASFREGIKRLREMVDSAIANVHASFPQKVIDRYNAQRTGSGVVSGAPASQKIGQPAAGVVRVRNKATGQTGSIPADKADAALKSGKFEMVQ
jgi:hypothetical protein